MGATAVLQTPENPHRRRWTREEFVRAADLGLFGPDERLELVEGEIIEQMPENSLHSSGVSAMEEALRAVLPAGCYLRIQSPLALGTYGQPHPDVAVVQGTWRDYIKNHPTTAALVVEVSDSSLDFDRSAKLRSYARARIYEYWILHLRGEVLEVHRGPVGDTYAEQIVLRSSDTVAPLFATDRSIAIADLLPEA